MMKLYYNTPISSELVRQKKRAQPALRRGLAWLLPLAAALAARPTLAQTTRADSLKNVSLEEVSVTGNRAPAAVTRLADVSGTAIYAGKKTEVIQLDKINANVALNNSRQLFARVPGINIVENDGAGISIGVATRGLNPNRITEFNTRQNGYDIAADALGYPENYYTPPAQGLARIEVVRGAASLQYGSQFGGLLNYVFRRGPTDRKISVNSQQTVGSFGLFSTFTSLGGTVGKVNYYAFFQHKQGDGWRQNTRFNQNIAYAGVQWAATQRLGLGFQFTRMNYLTQQPGGLTDAQFAQDARASYRNRNWFAAHWNLPALLLDYQLTPQTHLNARAFALLADRASLGNLSPPTAPEVDPATPRDYQRDDYRNVGAEVRVLHQYHLPALLHLRENSALASSLVVGGRIYHGDTHRRQGLGPGGSAADFQYLHPNELEGSDFRFPSTNVALFAENLFRLTSRLSLTPGLRYEYLNTQTNGYYADTTQVQYTRLADMRSRPRGFLLLGVGAAFDLTPTTNFYANFSQNYSPVNYNDVRTVNPNLRVDPNIQDVRGYNADLGYRGSVGPWLNFDMSVFYLAYNNRIGTLVQADDQANIYRYRTNIADSRSLGAETFAEADFLSLLHPATRHHLSLFSSVAYTDARYVHAPQASLEHRFVETAPQWIVRSGITYRGPRLSGTVQAAHTAQQFTDATNSRFVPNGILGLIPAYTVADASLSYTWRWLLLSGGVGNALAARYFTRRADGYPGPGILPSDGRNYYLTLGVKL